MKIDPGSRVFVDTAALVAVVIPRDSLHSNATEVMTELQSNGTTLVTTEFVLVEFANALSKANFRQTAVALIDDWINLSSFEIVWSNRQLFDSAYGIFRNRLDKEWSLTDCASFVVMKEQGISLAFTSDKHFEQAGFVKLLEN